MKSFSVRFSRDMPPAAVEVIGPDLHRLGRKMLYAGASSEFKAPLHSFARIHLPDGRIAVIPDVASLKEAISLQMLNAPRAARPRMAPRTAAVEGEDVQPSIRRIQSNEFVGAAWDDTSGRAPTFAPRWDWQIAGTRVRTPAWTFRTPSDRPRDLCGTFGTATVHVRLPGSVNLVYVDMLSRNDPPAIKVRTSRSEADFLAGKLHAGDVDSATSFLADLNAASYAEKIDEPHVAIMAAYLLMRLKRFDGLTVWTADYLAEYPHIPDSTVIRAWVDLHRHPGNMTAAGDMLAEIATGDTLPVYTEGLRLLIDGLHATGRQDVVTRLQSTLGMVMWTSPLTTVVRVSDVRGPVPSVTVAFTF